MLFVKLNSTMEQDNVAIRLKGFIQELGVTNSQFADKCGIPRPSLSQLLGGRNKKISDVIVGQIHQAYPELSVLWLLFGEGPMINANAIEAGPEGSSYMGSDRQDGIQSVMTDEIGQDGIMDGGLFDMLSENRSVYKGAEQYENLRALNNAKKAYNTAVNKGNDCEEKLADMKKQIERMKKNPRKVTQITVYYDDSTFETFYPR